MKTKITQASKKFDPIDITITLETPEDLKKFLLFTSAMSTSDSYSDVLMAVDINNVDYYVDGLDLAIFVDEMITSADWVNLCNVYKNHME